MHDLASRFHEYVRLDRRRADDGLTPGELESWTVLKRFLGRALDPELCDRRSDQRRSVRIPTRLTVTFRESGELRSCLMTDLSRDGAFVATGRPAAAGARLALRIDVPTSGERLEVPAEVVSVGDDRDDPGRRGMGLRFLEVPSELRHGLDALYEASLKAAAVRMD